MEAPDFLFVGGDYAGRNGSTQPRVIFLDLKLPSLNGVEILQKIRSDERTRTIPVVIITSSQEEAGIISSYSLGADSHMVKAVDFDQFIRVVEELGLYWLLRNKVPS